ncbi:hypothetical protein PSTEL_09950 [Paenibacillus stellifer]|uniref:Uncharacterized protein n=1 Tax=Paenibacillus stellifer TaxID=169760 RepID=A0A089LR60_9BACL|nr:hypothetical protein [Paenibacillus stellifer]AIQ63362.1 hypothetical protein PSTEL_09950 [Paenibacillus stellifer]
MIGKLALPVLLIGALVLPGSAASAENVSANDSSNSSLVSPMSYSETVLSSTRQLQQKVGFFDWEDMAQIEYTYKTITFNQSYQLTGTSVSYTAATGGPLTYTRYKVTTYNYTYY